MAFKFSLVSDLHVDMGSFPRKLSSYPFEENVVIAGDISNGLGGFKFFDRMKGKGHKFFTITGNHEHYANLSSGRTVTETEQRFHEMFPDTIETPEGLNLIGANGWYKVEDEWHWKSYMNDSRNTTMSMADVNHKAALDALYIESMLASLPGKFVVVTHSAPSEDTLDPRYIGSEGNPYYFNPLMGELRRKYADRIAVWCHGHTHAAQDMIVDGVRTVCNPRGYPRECPAWNPLTIEVNV